MNNEKAYSTSALIRNISQFSKPYRWRFVLASVFSIASDLAWLYPAYALGLIANYFSSYVPGTPLGSFWQIIVYLGIALLIHIITGYVGNLVGFRMAKKTAIDTEAKAMRHAFTLDMEWHESENTGNKVKRVARGADAVNQLIRMWFNYFIDISVSFFGTIYIVSRFDKSIAFMTLGFLGIYISVSIYLTRKAVKVQRTEQIREEEFSGLIFESINNIRTAKAMTMVRPLYTKIRGIANNLYDLAQRRIFWYQTSGVTRNLTAQTFRVAMISYIAIGIMHGRYELGFLVIFYSYFSNILANASRLADLTQQFTSYKQAVGRMVELLEVEPKTDVEEGKSDFPKNWMTIEFREVIFSYGDKKILEDISFTISRGEKIGIVGLSGAGKSTLFKLLLKEREAYGGEILVDGIPLRTIRKSDYFKHVAVVLQDTEVFSFSLRENITISSSEREQDVTMLSKAIEVAHVDEFLKALPLGMETLIGEKGVKLSGGEKQRVGLARAIFKDPELLLLDEATSHLDVESEEKIQDSLHKFFKSVTAVVIAHRLSTIKEMDKILVIEGGKIIEQGNFAELHKKKGRFYELWEKQKL